MVHPRTLILATLFLISGVGACRRRSLDRDLAALDRLQRLVDSAIVTGDTDRYLPFLTDDAVLMPPNAPPVRGKPAIRLWSEDLSRQVRIQRYAASDDEVIVSGDWAFRTASMDWTLLTAKGSKPIRDRGRPTRWRTRHLDATTDASHASPGLMHLGGTRIRCGTPCGH